MIRICEYIWATVYVLIFFILGSILADKYMMFLNYF